MKNNNWQIKYLKDLCTQSGEYGLNAPAIAFTKEFPLYLRITDITDDGIYSDKQRVSVAYTGTEKLLNNNDFLFARTGATVGKTYLNRQTDEKIAFAGYLIRFVPDLNKILPYYLVLYCQTKPYWKWVKIFSIRSGQPGISAEEYGKLPIPCPPMEEQRRIVEVLECWDKGIELVKKLIEQKELQKKGLLQNLVYKQPTCKNFYLGNLFSLGRGRVISKEEIQHNKGTYPVYSSQTSDNGILGYINSFDFEGEYLTWTTDGANAGKVFYRRGQFNCTNVCGTAKPHNSNLVNLYYVMSYLNKVTKRYVSYVGNPKLMNGVFSKIAIPLPEKTTQDWAATVLETADKEIDLLKQKLAKLEAQKKGLMQVLLTGKIRLK